MLSILYGALSPLGITRGYQCYAKGTVWPSNMNSENTLHARFHHCGGTIPAAGWTPAATPTARQTRSRPPSPTLQPRSRIVAFSSLDKSRVVSLDGSYFPSLLLPNNAYQETLFLLGWWGRVRRR
jgi:hypothetical protein